MSSLITMNYYCVCLGLHGIVGFGSLEGPVVPGLTSASKNLFVQSPVQ